MHIIFLIMDNLSNKFKLKEESKYYLSIKSNNIRTEIIGINNVQDYCRINNLPSNYQYICYINRKFLWHIYLYHNLL